MKINNVRFYVMCAESLKRDIDHGIWIDLSLGFEVLRDKIEQMLSRSSFYPKTSWQIAGCMADLPSEFESRAGLALPRKLNRSLNRFAQLKERSELGLALLCHFEGDVLKAEDTMDNHYMGDYCSEIEFTREIIKREYRPPSNIIDILDYKRFWEIWGKQEYMVFRLKQDGRLHIFRRQ